MEQSGVGEQRPPRRWIGYAVVALVAALVVAVPTAWATHLFDDVPTASPHHSDISGIFGAGITAGCNPPTNNLYCPDAAVRRDQMATFLRRGLGRATRVNGPLDTFVGSGSGFGPEVTVATLTISVPGVSGTQFVNLHGEATLFTNSTRAAACTAAIFCNIYLHLYDGTTQLAESFVRLSADGAGSQVGVSTVHAVAAGTTKTYTLRAEAFNVNTNLGIVHLPRLMASTFPFGGSGGSTLTASAEAPAAAAGRDSSIGEAR